MSTSTATTTTTAIAGTLPASPSSIHLPSESAAASTLRTLYPRAAKAFLHRDFALTHTLLVSAFEVLDPPSSLEQDALDVHRKKWDVLRITLDTTLRGSPPPPAEAEALPPDLRSSALLSTPALLASLHTRSLKLFTPLHHNPSAAYLPSQILLTLALAALKLDAPQDARAMVEDWLSCRVDGDAEGYAKVLTVYCAHILGRLDDWDYARDFLQYEHELSADQKQQIVRLVDASQEQTLSARRQEQTPPPTPSTASSTPRAASPSPSAISSASTVKPGLAGTPDPLSPIPPPSAPSVASTAVPRRRRPPTPAKNETLPRSFPVAPPVPSHAPQTPTVLAVLRSTLRTQLASLGRMHMLAIVLTVLLPLFSFSVRLRRAAPQRGELGAAAAVRSRLTGAATSGGSVAGSVWSELVRAIVDAVTMAGRGLV